MRRKKLVTLISSVCLILVLASLPFMAACPAPEEEEKVHLEMYSNPTGGIGYTMSYALCDLINKHSDMLSATCIETASTTENIKTLIAYPEKKDYFLAFGVTHSLFLASMGEKPFDEPWDEWRIVGLCAIVGSPLLTLDPNIRTPQDMIGKRIGLDPVGSTNEYIPTYLMMYAWDIWDKVNADYGFTCDVAADSLMDGTIDVTWQGAVMLGPGEYKEWVPMPSFERILATKQVYFIEMTDEDFAEAREGSGLGSVYPIGFRAQTVGETTSPNFMGMANPLMFWVHKDMPDDVVTEICRIFYEYAEEFESYHAVGRGLTKETVADVPTPRDTFHPAAIAYYESMGVEVIGR